MTCRLNGSDKQNVTDVYNDLNEIIDKGQNQEFVERIDDAIKHLVGKS